MRAFVTGASGFIGSHLIQALQQKKDWTIQALVRKRKVLSLDKLTEVKGDITEPATFADALAGSDILFHLASALGASLIQQQEFFRINAKGTENILAAARAAGVKRVIHFSSAGALGKVLSEDIADEAYPPHPIMSYDRSKLEGEQVALRYAASEDMNIQIIRPGWVYGPGDRRTFKLIKAIARKRFLLVTRGQRRQTPVFIDDLIQGIFQCLDRGQPGEIYHLAGSEVLTVRQMVETIAEATGTAIPHLYLPLLPVKLAAWPLGKLFSWFKKEAPLTPGKLAFFTHPKPLSIQKAVDALDYSPQTDFYSGMSRTVRWYREQGWLD